MASALLAVFRVLTSAPTAPFYEKAPLDRVLAWARRNLGRRVSVRLLRGGAILRYEGAGPGPALALAAHIDHPAFHLRRVTSRGAEARLQGGLPPHLLPGCGVEAFPAAPRDNEPAAAGVLGKALREGVYPVSWTRPPSKGAPPKFAVLAFPPCQVRGPWLLSRSIDDLLGCAVSLEVLSRAARGKWRTNLTVLLHRAEEVGFIGALDLISAGAVSRGDSVISVETSREMPGARPGRGPVVRLGDKACLFDPNLTALLDAAAQRLKARGIRTQRLRLTGGTCEATAYQAYGYEAAGAAVPLVNYHNGWGAKAAGPEKVRFSDAQGLVRLLAEAAKLFAGSTLRGALRSRLDRRLRRTGRLLRLP